MRSVGPKFESLTNAMVTWLLLVSIVLSSASVRVYAEDPASQLAQAAQALPPVPTTAATAPAIPDIPQTLPYGESLDKVAYFEKFVSGLYSDFLNAPIWFLTTAGLGIAMVAANQLYRFFSKDVVTLMRQFIAYRHIRDAHNAGEVVFHKIETYADMLGEDAKLLWKSTQELDALRKHIFVDEIKPNSPNMKARRWLRESAMTGDGKLSALSPIEQMNALLTDEKLRDELLDHRGRFLLETLDEKQSDHRAVERRFFSTFGKIATAVQDYYERVAKVGNIWFARNKELQPSIPKIEAKPHVRGGLGTIQHWNDLGGQPVYTDPRDMEHELRNTVRLKCDGHFSKLGSLKTDHEVAVKVAAVRGGALTALTAGAVGTYLYGKSKIIEVYDAEPAKLIEERANLVQAQVVTAGIVAATTKTSVQEMAEKVHLWRLDPKNENAHAIFRIFEDQIRLNLPNISTSLLAQLKEKLGNMQIDEGAWQKTLNAHLSSPDELAGTIDMAIADSIVNEAKVSDPAGFENMLLRTDPTDTIKEKSRNTAISYVYKIAPKYVWDVIVDRETYPSAAGMVEETARVLDTRRKEVMASDVKARETSPTSRAGTAPPAAPKDKTVNSPMPPPGNKSTSAMDVAPMGSQSTSSTEGPAGDSVSSLDTSNSLTSSMPAMSTILIPTMPPMSGAP